MDEKEIKCLKNALGLLGVVESYIVGMAVPVTGTDVTVLKYERYGVLGELARAKGLIEDSMRAEKLRTWK